MKFPTVSVENFFDKPDDIVKYANSLEYKTPEKNQFWIGQRSELLHLIHPKLFHFICEKVISVFYDGSKEDINYDDAQICFQKISKKDWQNNKIKTHRDISDSLSGLIYLSKEENFANGTKISIDSELDHIMVSSKYNSMLCYDGSQLHGPIGSTGEDRLTIVFFIHNVLAEKTPYERLNNIKGF